MKEQTIKIAIVTMALAALLLSGCATTESSKAMDGNRAVLDKHGRPNQRYLIGSGVEVRFKAPEDGHIYLVETNADKTLIIKPLEKGVEYTFDVKNFSNFSEEEKGLLKQEGFDPKNMDFAVYFIPDRDLVDKPKQMPFDKNGLPKAEYYVGGGFDLNYRAPERGVVYVIEANSGKIVQTESLTKGYSFNLPINPADVDHHTRLKAMGIDPLNMKLQMYFVPEPRGE